MWSRSYRDLKHQVTMKVEYDLVRIIQDRENLREVVAEALGGKTETGDKPPETFDQLAAILAEAGGSVHN